MGTNYYLRAPEPEPCYCCGHVPEQEEIHLGKSSIGWEFTFKGNKDPQSGPVVETYTQWLENIYTHTGQGWMIWNEDGMVTTAPELARLIDRKRGQTNHFDYCQDKVRYYGQNLVDNTWKDEAGNAFLGCEFS